MAPCALIVATSLLLIALAVPLARRRVPPNRVYGFRTPATLRDETIWYEVNELSGRDLLVVGGGALAITVSGVAAGLAEEACTAIAAAWLGLGAIVSTVRGLLLVRRLKKKTS